MKKWFHTLSAQILNTLLWVFPYQLTVSILLAVLTALLNRIGLFFVASAGEAAITNGNYRVFFSRWQGWALLALGVLACALYICLDIGALIRITDLKIHGQKERILTSCMHSLKLLPKFFTPSGLLILLAVTFGVPLANIGFSITLTEGFYIPNVYSVDLMSNPVTSAIYDIGIACLAILITKGIFTIHFMVLQKDSAKNAFLHSAELTKSFFIRFLILFLLLTILFYGLGKGVDALFLTLPDWLISRYVSHTGIQRFLYLLFNLNGVIILFLFRVISTPLFMYLITRWYYRLLKQPAGFQEESLPSFLHQRKLRVIIPSALLAASIVLDVGFDTFFPLESQTEIIAHRAGGNLASENTMLALTKAEEAGTDGSEIDVQRTKDGQYIVFHDTTFRRLCGVSSAPSDLTYAEIQKLKVRNTTGNDLPDQPIPTLEQMLKQVSEIPGYQLYIELKGSTADAQMAEDVTALVKKYSLEERTVITSISYEPVAYIEENYPEMETGYIYHFSFGDIGSMNVDWLVIEEEVATDEEIAAIHQIGKKVSVWTVDSRSSIRHFLISDADSIITNQVDRSLEVKEELSQRTDLQRIQDVLLKK